MSSTVDEEGGSNVLFTLFSGVSKGTRYKVMGGGAHITLECTPSVATHVTSGSCTAGVVYSSRIIVPTVNLTGTTDFFHPARAIEFLTGQRVKAEIALVANPQDTSIAPLQIDPNSYSWTLPSMDPFKDFVYGSTGGRVDLQASDKQQNPLNFYGNQQGAGQLQCTFKIVAPSGTRIEGSDVVIAKSKTLGCKRPTKQGWNLLDGAVQIIGSAFGFYASSPSTAGQQWKDVEYLMPQEFGNVGSGCFCQLITPNRNYYGTRPNGNTVHYASSYNGQTVLDTGYPYAFGSPWSLPGKGAGVDSPAQSFSLSVPFSVSWNTSSAEDHFKTWAMYRPPSKDSQPTTWIPIMFYSWQWNASAVFDPASGVWALDAGYSGSHNEAPSDTTEFPSWSNVLPVGSFNMTLVP